MSEAKKPSTQPGQSRPRRQERPVGVDRASHAVLDRLVRREPNNEQAWLALAALTQHPLKQRAHLRQVLRINPQNRQAIQRLRQVDAQRSSTQAAPFPLAAGVSVQPAATKPSTPDGTRMRLVRRWLGIWLLIAALVIIFGGFAAQAWVAWGAESPVAEPTTLWPSPPVTSTPTATIAPTPTPSAGERVAAMVPQLQDAWQARDWPAADGILYEMRVLDPAYPGLQAARCDTYLHWAGDLIELTEVDQAYGLYRKATQVCSDDPPVKSGRSLSLQYLTGKWRYEHQLWRQSALVLQSVYDADPSFADTSSLLYEAYMAWAKVSADQQDYQSVRSACESVLAIRPDDAEAAELLSEAEEELKPTPTPRPPQAPEKRIEVNISQQRMYVWEGDRLLYNWLCSTGEPGRNTAAGHWRVLDKIPEAWASSWSLRMPYWMGVYYAGTLENGIHALPILPNGQILWDGFLGTPVSYGCIILSTENARTLFNWAHVGTPVWIHY